VLFRSVEVLLFDIILGTNSSLDPVGELLEALQQAQKIAQKRGDMLVIVASICGTDGDPQDFAMQTKMLKKCGVIVFQTNAKASRFCADILSR